MAMAVVKQLIGDRDINQVINEVIDLLIKNGTVRQESVKNVQDYCNMIGLNINVSNILTADFFRWAKQSVQNQTAAAATTLTEPEYAEEDLLDDQVFYAFVNGKWRWYSYHNSDTRLYFACEKHM